MAAYLQVIDVDERAANVVELGTRIELIKMEVLIGRHPMCDFVVDIPRVSRFHYRVKRVQDRYILYVNWQSPTTFNGQPWDKCILDFDEGHVILSDCD
ncbi:MAG: FHA domain-containing protein [Planctomycetota bacterium]